MEEITQKTIILKEALKREIFKGFDSFPKNLFTQLIQPILNPSITRFSHIAAKFDLSVKELGFKKSLEDILPIFINEIHLSGSELIPTEGPLLVVSNHPGTIDSLIIAANIPRDDLSIIASGYDFLRNLKETSRHLIFATTNQNQRMSVVRQSIRHLRNNGALLIFPAGRIEPDPAVLPGAAETIENWSKSLEIFVKKVPDVNVIISIVSNVFKPIFLSNPILQLWQGIKEKQAVAEVFQMSLQLGFPKLIRIKPSLSFGAPMTMKNFLCINEEKELIRSIVHQAKELLKTHSK
jgi:hypothetical protein